MNIVSLHENREEGKTLERIVVSNNLLAVIESKQFAGGFLRYHIDLWQDNLPNNNITLRESRTSKEKVGNFFKEVL